MSKDALKKEDILSSILIFYFNLKKIYCILDAVCNLKQVKCTQMTDIELVVNAFELQYVLILASSVLFITIFAHRHSMCSLGVVAFVKAKMIMKS